MKRQNKVTLADNLLWLREHFGDLYNKARNKEPNRDNVRTVMAHNGLALLEVHVGNHWSPLSSVYDPIQEAMRWAAQVDVGQAEEIVLFGVGLAYHVAALSALYPNLRFRLYEPYFDVYLQSLEAVDLSSLHHERIVAWEVDSLPIGASSNPGVFTECEVRLCNDLFAALLDQTPVILVAPSYQKLFPTTTSSFLSKLRQFATNVRFNLGTVFTMEKYWVLNALSNLPFTLDSPSVESLRPLIEGKPVIIVSSGPSLEQDIEHLKRARDHVTIIASGSSVNGLLHHGIVPHAVVSIDPYINNKKVFDLMAEYDATVPIVFGTTLYFEILQDRKYPYLYHAINSQDKITTHLLGTKEVTEYVYSDAPTVAAFTLQVTYALGANPIIFVGQDLAFPNDKFYASGVTHHRETGLSEEEKAQYFEVEQVGGGNVLTSTTHNHMRTAIEYHLAEFVSEDPRRLFINTSPVGARIRHTVEKRLEECLDTYLDFAEMQENPFEVGNSLAHDDKDIEGVKELYRMVWSEQEPLNEAFNGLTELLEQLNRAKGAQDIQLYCEQLDQQFNAIRENKLYPLVYEPLLSIQTDLYRRTALHIMNEPPTREKADRIISRLVPLIREFRIFVQLFEELGLPDRLGKSKPSEGAHVIE